MSPFERHPHHAYDCNQPAQSGDDNSGHHHGGPEIEHDPVLAGRKRYGPHDIIGSKDCFFPTVDGDPPAGVIAVAYHQKSIPIGIDFYFDATFFVSQNMDRWVYT